MDIEHIWKRGGEGQLNDFRQQLDLTRMKSKLPLQKLKKNLAAGIGWSLLITAGYIVLFVNVAPWQVRFALVVVSVFNLVIAWDSWRLYRNLSASIIPGNSLRQELQRHYDGFMRWWKVQEKVSLFVYPIAATGGFLLGGTVGSGKAVEAFLYRPKILLLLGVTLLVLVPTCYFLARWMFNFAFGKHLKRLKAAIQELDGENENDNR